jgi:hypothetical protein
LSGIALAVILAPCSRELPTPPEPTFTSIQLPPCCGAPPEKLIHDPCILDRPEARTIILVRVVEAEVQEDFASVPYAKMLVLKSWQGPFSAGEVLRTPKLLYLCDGKLEDCAQYNFQLGGRGNEFLIMSPRGQKT